jgi:repressor LexA
MEIIKDLTTKQAAVLEFVRRRILEEGRPPTLREIGGRFGFRSTGTTRDYLKTLARKGYINLRAKQSRAIGLAKPLAFRIPVLGRIMAGLPDLAWEETEEYLSLDDLIPRPDQPTFTLRIKGDSMKDKGILDGDIAVVRRQRLADAGDIVAALLSHEATIKVLKKDKAGFFLAPANESYDEIRRPFTIIGKVTAVIKRF